MRTAHGKIVKGIGGLYTVETDGGAYSCMARGLFRKQKLTPLVGDEVEIQVIDEEKREGYLLALGERRNELIRPKAANVDLAIIVFAAANPEPLPDLLDSFLLSCARQKVDAAICVNKTDLAMPETVLQLTSDYTLAGYTVLYVSAALNEGMEAVRRLTRGKTVILAGPSGVGKSSLVNALLPSAGMETGELSLRLARGKHTTRHTELLRVDEDTYIVDSPGFSSLGVESIGEEELQTLYPEFQAYAGQCFYGDCLHVSEPDCAVRAHIGETVGERRYKRYVAFLERIRNAR